MTIEEAIEVLAQDLPCETDEDLSEAMTMAIKALEQQACEDAISRKDMLAIFRQSNSLSQAWDGFEKLPPVTPKSKSESEHDHEVVKAYNDGQAFILDKIKAEIEGKMNSGQWSEAVIYGMKKTIAVIDKYRGE